MDSLRIEKSYRMWGQDLTIEYSAFEAGLDRFVALDKGDFVGRDALVAQREAGVPQDFVTLEIEADDADPWGNEPIYDGEAMVGRATSGAYGHTVGKSLALGYVARDHAVRGRRLAVEILGERKARRGSSPTRRWTPPTSGCAPSPRAARPTLSIEETDMALAERDITVEGHRVHLWEGRRGLPHPDAARLGPRCRAPSATGAWCWSRWRRAIASSRPT